MNHFTTPGLTLAAALLLIATPTCAQVYSWKDPDTGQSKFSNVPPPWYSRGETVSGPRVTQTLRGKVVDDTALPYEDRLRLSGKSKDYIENLRLQKNPGSPAARDPARESAQPRAEPAGGHATDTTPPRGETVGKKKS